MTTEPDKLLNEEALRWIGHAVDDMQRMREEIDWCCKAIDAMIKHSDLYLTLDIETLLEMRSRFPRRR